LYVLACLGEHQRITTLAFHRVRRDALGPRLLVGTAYQSGTVLALAMQLAIHSQSIPPAH